MTSKKIVATIEFEHGETIVFEANCYSKLNVLLRQYLAEILCMDSEELLEEGESCYVNLSCSQTWQDIQDVFEADGIAKFNWIETRSFS